MRVRELLYSAAGQYTEHQTTCQASLLQSLDSLQISKGRSMECGTMDVCQRIVRGNAILLCRVCVVCDHEVMHESSLALAQTNNGKVLYQPCHSGRRRFLVFRPFDKLPHMQQTCCDYSLFSSSCRHGHVRVPSWLWFES